MQDPRERPLAKQGAADERHARFADERSDFLALLKLWKLQGEQGLRRLCRDNFLSYPRMREWRDVHLQLQNAVGELDWKMSSAKADKPEGYRAIHRALLAGLLGNVGMKDEADNNYTGARGIKILGASRLGHEEAGQVGRRGGARRDHAALRAHGGHHRAAVAGGAGCAPLEAPSRQSRTGRRCARRSWRSSAARSTGCRCTRTGACTMGRSTRTWRAASSFARRWWKGSSTRARRSSRTTGACSRRSSAWSTSRAAPTSWWTTS